MAETRDSHATRTKALDPEKRDGVIAFLRSLVIEAP